MSMCLAYFLMFHAGVEDRMCVVWEKGVVSEMKLSDELVHLPLGVSHNKLFSIVCSNQ